jgi:hypothetical protein
MIKCTRRARIKIRKLVFFAFILSPFFAYSAAYEWRGTTDNSWSDGTNWDVGAVPGSGDDVTIDGSNPNSKVTMNGAATDIQFLTIYGGASLTLTHDLEIITDCSLGVASAGTLDLNGNNLQITGDLTLGANGGISTAAASNLHVVLTSSLSNNISTAGGNIQLDGTVTVDATSALSTAGGSINLGSTVTGSGSPDFALSAGAGLITISGAISSIATLSVSSSNTAGVVLPQTNSTSLSVTAITSIIQSGAWNVTGATNLYPNAHGLLRIKCMV